MDTVEEVTQQDHPFSLPLHVVYLLEEANVEDPKAWMTKLHPEAMTSPDVNVQRFHTNRCWLNFLITANTPDQLLLSRNARGCLVNGQWPLEEWLANFKTVVIPCALALNLLQKKS